MKDIQNYTKDFLFKTYQSLLIVVMWRFYKFPKQIIGIILKKCIEIKQMNLRNKIINNGRDVLCKLLREMEE